MSEPRYHASSALLPEGWADDVLISVDARGSISSLETDAAPPAGSIRMPGPVLPGMANLHSHAFQRAMAGLGEEAASAGRDSFWTWRETMYRFLERLGADEVGAIAARLYLEMLKAGYTTVGEFHYLHHQTDGTPYDDPAEIAHRVVDASRRTGIAMTLLPVLYAHGGFGETPPSAGQRRFINDAEGYMRLWETLSGTCGDALRLGIAPHSLRAVSDDVLAQVLAAVERIDASVPVHIHIAEQVREVDECLAWSGSRPVDWLLRHFPVNSRWCLVHATHVTAGEIAGIARSGAVAGLCPTTEANLGDGMFPLGAFLKSSGIFGIGSDSHVSTSPVEELRWLEYVQRLRRRRRCVVTTQDGKHTGETLWRTALKGGARALGQPISGLKPGCHADFICLDPDHPSLIGRRGGRLVDSFIFAGNGNPVTDVVVRGRHVIAGGRHVFEKEIDRDYRDALVSLMA